MFNSINRALQKLNPFAKLTREQFGTWALINTAAIAAIVHTRRPAAVCASIGVMIGSFRAARNENRSCSSIFFAAVLGVGFGGMIGQAYSSYLADLASGEEIVTRA
ncbi:MAG: hypothetical protein IT584_02270 [Chlamydiae bacterium]|nr:hypothetical protein [Chlamydiota bacterium]